MRTMGEILNGDRTYFPMPVVYANDRSPIIPSQIRARPIPVAAAAGMGSFLEETSLTSAVAAPAALVGVPLGGIALVLGAAALYGFMTGYLGKPARASGRRRRK